jgi:FAD/FMN-containing dehydrogenase
MTMTLTSPSVRADSIISQPRRFEHSDGAIGTLEAILDGAVLLPGDAAYDEARLIRNRLHNRLPAIIVQVASAEDVAQAVRFARDFDLRIAVRSGGHSFSGHSVIDDGLVIDLRNLNAVSVDAERKTAKAQAGATSAILAAAAQPYGLALSTGDVPSVALGGLTLGGGIGWMVREQGLTIDNLISVELVTADAEIIRASADENPELFWALRGGGGNFGVVTEFEYRLHEAGTVLAGLIALPATADAIRNYAEWAKQAPNAMTTITYIMQAPPAPFVPEPFVGQVCAMVIACYTGDAEQGQTLLDGLRQVAPPLFEFVAPMPYPAIYAFTEDGTYPTRELARSMFMDELPDEVIDAVLDAMANASPTSLVQLRVLGGRMAEVPAEATAFAHRDKPFLLVVARMWEDGEGAQETAWVLDLFGRIQPHGRGVYANFTQDEANRIREAYPAGTYDRLAAVKREYDPGNVFAMNLNVQPKA